MRILPLLCCLGGLLAGFPARVAELTVIHDEIRQGEFAGAGDRYLVLANRDAAGRVAAGLVTVTVPLAEGDGELLRVTGAGD